MKRRLLFLIQCAITVGLLILIFRNRELRENMTQVFGNAQPGWLVMAAFCALLVHLSCWLRWHLCMWILGIQPALRRSFRFYWISQFSSLFLFGQVGADAVRIGLLWHDGLPKPTAAMSVLLDRICGLIALVLASIIFTTFRVEWFQSDPLTANLVYILWGYLSILVLAFAGAFAASRMNILDKIPARAPLRAQVIESGQALERFSRNPTASLTATAIAFSSLMLYFTVFALSGRAFALDIPWPDVFSVMPVVDTVAALPLSISGLGVREKMFHVMLERLAGVPQASSVLMSLGGFTAMTLWCAAGGLCLPGYKTITGKHVPVKDLGAEV